MSEFIAMIEVNKTQQQLEREELVRSVLEAAARRLEGQTFGSEAYQKAFKKAASVIREMKS